MQGRVVSALCQASAALPSMRKEIEVKEQMKRKSVTQKIAKALTGKDRPSPEELKVAADRFNQATIENTNYDPIAELFTGIQFRNGGKEEALRRVRIYCNTTIAKANLAGQQTATAQGEAMRLHIEGLENAIRDLQRKWSEAVINAARPRKPFGLLGEEIGARYA